MRDFVVILGDQLDRQSAALDGFDPHQDLIWMAEVIEEATHVPSHKARIALFLAAMRHFADELRASGWPLVYLGLDTHPYQRLDEALAASLRELKPRRVIMVEAGEWRVQKAIAKVCLDIGVPLELREDRHFIASRAAFAAWAKGRKQLRLEHWYRHLRQRTGLLMDGNQPAGGRWNFDQENRAAFGKQGPGMVPPPRGFAPSSLTREVMDMVNERFATHPGKLEHFDWPVTAEQAQAALQAALDDFISQRLPAFGRYQDAMWSGEPWLYHSRLSAALNLKLLDPMQVCRAVETAWRAGQVPLAAAEGFIRQILGWREYVRGLYWLYMPAWLDWSALDAQAPLPDFFWTGDCEMRCLREVIGQTLTYGYAHHIQRLMVTGLFCLLLGVNPQKVHRWYLAIYVDAVEWVELPNVLGMSQFADGGRMASKPYIASGRYIARMSNYCAGCRYRPDQAIGPHACPFTTLYWAFLDRHRQRYVNHPRIGPQVRNLDRLSPEHLAEIRAQAELWRQGFCG